MYNISLVLAIDIEPRKEKSTLAGHNGVARYVGLSSPAMTTTISGSA